MEQGVRHDMLDRAYGLVLVGKGALGASQLVAALAVALGSTGAIGRFAAFLTHWELAEDPSDPVASAVMAWSSQQTGASAHFYAIYLTGHGVLNLGVAVALFLRLRGAYGVSMTALLLFVAYQIGRFVTTGDPALLLLTTIDVIVIWLAWLERHRITPSTLTKG